MCLGQTFTLMNYEANSWFAIIACKRPPTRNSRLGGQQSAEWTIERTKGVDKEQVSRLLVGG
jgi:hypothetical protein